MNRRNFLQLCAAAPLAGQSSPSVAFTFDDFRWSSIPKLQPDDGLDAYLEPLAKRKVKATLFVCAKYAGLDTAGTDRAKQATDLLKRWAEAGHSIGNHSLSHYSFHDPKIAPPFFFEDVQRGAAAIEHLPGYEPIFRFPFLKEGHTTARRDACRTFLTREKYRTGHVSIDASDWYYDQRMRARLAELHRPNPARYRDAFLAHIWDRATYYDGLSRKVLDRSIPHVLLLHYTYLNALFLEDLAAMFESKGWRLISAKEAFQDPVYTRQPDIVPAGESLLWGLAKESRHFEGQLRYPGEDGDYEKSKVEALRL